MAVVDSYGNKLYEINEQYKPADLGGEISYADSSYYDKYQLRPYNPADLWQKKGQYRQYDLMREDDQISSALTLKKLIVLSSGWMIETEDDDIRDFIEYNLNYCLDDLFDKKLFQILSAIDYGFSVSEKIYNWIDYNGKKKIGITSIKTRAPHTFEFYQTPQGDIEYMLQHTGINSDIKIYPDQFGKFIIYSYNSEFDNPYGKSDIDTGVYRAWWSKNAVIKFWNIYLERCGVPPAVATIPRSAGTAEKNTLMRMLDNLQAKSAFIIPEDFKLEMMQITKGTTDFESAINKYDSMIARKFLLPDLLGMSGSKTGGGSYALGKEQFDLFYRTIDYIKQDVQNIVNRDIIKPLVMWNFGTGHDVKWSFKKIDDDKKVQLADLWLEGVRTGKIPINYSLVNWFLSVVNAPEMSEEEYDKLIEIKEKEAEEISGGKEPIEDTEEEETDSADAEDDTNKEYIEKDKSGIMFSRPFTQYEDETEIKRIASDFQDMEMIHTMAIANIFKLSINRIIDDIKRKMIIEKKKFSAINGLNLMYQDKIKRAILDCMKDAYKRGKISATKKKKNAIIDTWGLDDKDVIEWLESSSVYFLSAETDELLKRIKGILIESIRAGNSTRDALAMIDEDLRSAGYDVDLIGEVSQGRIERLVRTIEAKAYNEARAQQYKEDNDLIAAFQYSAVMDERTSELCEALDGKVFSTAELDYYNPPNHFNCRSIIVPIVVGEKYEMSKMPATEQEMGGFLTLSEE